MMFMCSLAQVQAQTYCDSVDVKVTAHPFYDSLLTVRVNSQSQHAFSYPSFIIKSGNDTLAIETPNFFMGPNGYHAIDIIPGRVPGKTVAGTLSMYGYMWDSLKCNWLLQDVNLCPDSCVPAVLHLDNMGGAMFTGTAKYELKNSNAQVVKTGTFTITSTQQTDGDTICLYPGLYTLHISQIALTPGGAKYYGVHTGPLSSGYPEPYWYHNQTSDTSFAFEFYKRCINTQSVPNVTNSETAYKAYVQDGRLKVTGTTGQPLGNVLLYSVDGKVVAKEMVKAPQHAMDVRHLPSGIYLLQIGQQNRSFSQKIYIGNE